MARMDGESAETMERTAATATAQKSCTGVRRFVASKRFTVSVRLGQKMARSKRADSLFPSPETALPSPPASAMDRTCPIMKPPLPKRRRVETPGNRAAKQTGFQGQYHDHAHRRLKF